MVLLYYGPPTGIYQAKKFEDLATVQIPRKLLRMGKKNEFIRKVGSDMIVTYSYTGAEVEITHEIMSANRCEVNIKAASTQNLESIVDFIHSKEKE